MGRRSSSSGPTASARPAISREPPQPGERPGVVLFEEWWGLDDRIKADRRPPRVARLQRARSRSLSRAQRRDGRRGEPPDARARLRRRRHARRRRRRALLARQGAARVGVVGLLHGRRAGDARRDARSPTSMRPAFATATRRPRPAIPRRSRFRSRGTGRLRRRVLQDRGRRRDRAQARSAPACRTSSIATTPSTVSTIRASPARAASGTTIASTPKRRGSAPSSSSTARCANVEGMNAREARALGPLLTVVPRARIEPATPHFSGACSTD